MDTKFTKGEWFACCGSYEVAVLNDEKFIETLITDTGPPTTPCDVESQANQKLIAAAPDMYSLLNDILNNYETDTHIDNQINVVLAKARGE